MEHHELKQMQGLDLEIKILKTQQRIKEWYNNFNGEVYVSFSGGKDSTVLLHMAREIYPDIEAVFVDTMLEYPEIREFVKTIDNVTTVRPKMSYKEVSDTYGYPVVSKEQSQYIYQYRTALSEKTKDTRLNGNKYGRGKISEKHKYLIDAPFKVSDKCCDVMKKAPVKQFEKETGKYPIIGVMAEESSKRVQDYLKVGCNSFDSKRPISRPMGFWTEQDVLQYIHKFKIPYCSVYGDIIKNSKGKLQTTKCDRTGCFACAYGLGQEQGINRFQRMETTHPKLHKFCLENLGLKEVLEFMKIPHSRAKVTKAKYKIETSKISCRVETGKLEKLKARYGNLTNTEIIDKLINEKLSDSLVI